MTTHDAIIARILDREGDEFTDHPADRGGPTKYGITMPILRKFLDREPTIGDMKSLTPERAIRIYRQFFVMLPGFDRIEDPELREQVIDAGVHMSPGWAARRLQEIVGVKADGIVGPITLKAVNFAGNTNGLANSFVRRRADKYVRIVQNDLIKRYGRDEFEKMQAVFLAGWMRRALEFLP